MNEEQEIKNVLGNQQAAWNKGDIESFMDGYWQSDSLMFVSKSGITYGWQNTLNNYKTGYPDAASMGLLDFDIQQVNRLSDSYYFIVGKWHLTRHIGDLGGHFTLLFKKVDGKWVIISDHTS